MKKVLLGLLALSATLMATTTLPSTGIAGDAGNNQIDVKTKAYIVDSGLIITETNAENATAIKSVELDHGTILVGTKENSTTTRTVYIKRYNGKNFPANTFLEVELKSPSGNNLINSSSSKFMAHTLTAHVNGSTDASLSLSGTKQNHAEKFTTRENQNNIPVVLASAINSDQYATSENLPEGEYNNISTLSVKFSKNPGTVTEGVTR